MDRFVKMADNYAEQQEKNTIRKLKRYYRDALDNIRDELAKLNRKGALTANELRKYNRLENLNKKIDQEMGKATGASTNSIRGALSATYVGSYLRLAYGYERELQTKLFSKEPDVDTDNEQDAVGWRTRNRQNNNRGANQLKQEIFSAIQQEQTMKQIDDVAKDRVNKVLGATAFLVGFEILRTHSKAKEDIVDYTTERGVIQRKRWQATLDGRTRDSHQDLDGVEVKRGENFRGHFGSGPQPRLMDNIRENANCRCTAFIVIEGFEPTERRARGEGVIPYTNFNDWKKNRIG